MISEWLSCVKYLIFVFTGKIHNEFVKGVNFYVLYTKALPKKKKTKTKQNLMEECKIDKK